MVKSIKINLKKCECTTNLTAIKKEILILQEDRLQIANTDRQIP